MEGTLRTVIFTTLVLTFLTSFSNVNGYQPYPTTDCFKDVPQLAGKLLADNENIADCIDDYPDKESFCFKICMMKENDIIQVQKYPPADESSESEENEEVTLIKDEKLQAYNYSVDDVTIVAGLLKNYYDLKEGEAVELEKDPTFDKITDEMEDRAKKCESMGFLVPKAEEDCNNFSPETKEKVEKLQKCIEAAYDCP